MAPTDSTTPDNPALPTPLVTSQWLRHALGRPSLVVLDASWYLPQQGRDARAEFLAGHIPGARFFDLDAASDPASDLPHMLPTAEHFAATMRSLGISADSDVVVYDGSGNQLSAPRLWWMLRAFGHGRVAVLDGGFRHWLAEGLPTEGGEPAPSRPGTFQPRLRHELVRTRADVESALAGGTSQVGDARGSGRFRGEVPEPRPGLRSGHMAGSCNLPFTELVDPETGLYRHVTELRRRIEESGLQLDRPLITSCGSGVTACSLALALQLAGAGEVAVYDGSWAEWGQENNRAG